MSTNITSRLAKFNELVPSNIPFVEGKLKGHQDRKNYSVIGPGVSEDAKQNVKIAEEHGFNIGAVSAAPMNGSGLHSHTTAEVFIIHQGSWRFYWGVDGTEGEVILNSGDVASFPTNMFRGFQNVSKDEALMFVVLGENDPGVITWTPKLLKDAKDSGMVLMDDNSLIDTEKQEIPDEDKIIQPLKEQELETFDHYSSSEIEKYVIRFDQGDKYFVDDEHYNSNKIINYIDKFDIHNKTLEPYIPHKTGFSLSLLQGKDAHIHEYTLEKSEVFHCLDGKWEIQCNEEKIVIGAKDTFSVPKNSLRSIRQIGDTTGNLYIIRQTN
tara:strand:- start:517 stop:1488 length:972 start_codon:yes stop_codon:yes gene_type:complete